MSADRFDLGATRLRVVVATPEATVIEAEIDAGGGAPPHVHTREDETLHVLEGAIAVEHERASVTLQAGDAIVLPRGLRHAFRNDGPEVARMLFFCAPGGLEAFFREASAAQTEEQADAAAARAGLRF